MLVAAWWVALLLHPAWREPFSLRGAPPEALLAFGPADLMLLAAGSLALAARPRGMLAEPLAFVVAGAALYATLYTLASAALGASGWTGFVLMAPSALFSNLAAIVLRLAQPRDLPSRSAGNDGP